MNGITKVIILIIVLFFVSTVAVGGPPQVSAQAAPPVLAFYYAWFDHSTWASGQSVDLPAEPYASADRATIERQVAQAQNAGINAFVQSWYGPQEANNQTETNFRLLLEVAAATGFRAAVDFETTGPFFGDAGAVSQALSTLLVGHAQHPAYLRYQGKPLIFFWRQQRFSIEEWAAIRSQVDPNHDSYWIAEGVDIAYQAVFDGHHLYNIAWAASPADQLAKWGSRVRAYEDENQVDRLWVATAMPGYNDTRLPRENSFAVPRRGGDYFRETFRGAIASQPDMVIITSFNEWLEGTHIEPSQTYGHLYLDVIRELVTNFQGSPPPQAVPAAAPEDSQAAQEGDPPEETEPEVTPPAGPYIRVEDLVNVRSGPSTAFTRVGQLEAGSQVPVIGRLEAGDWWQIDFEAGPEGKGWVSAEVVEFVGDNLEVPFVEAPQLPTPDPAEESRSAAEVDTSTPEPTTEPTVALPTVEIPPGGINVRNGPGLDFDLLGRLDEGTSAAVVGKNEVGDWWQIRYEAGEDGLGWITAALVDFSGTAALVPVVIVTREDDIFPTPTTTPTVPRVLGQVEALDAVNVRTEPALDAVRVGGFYLGETAAVFAVSDDGQWWQIEFLDGPNGMAWVAAEFVQFQGDEANVPIIGLGTPTATPGPTRIPRPTALPASPTRLERPPTFAPTATSVYQATAETLLENRGTPDPRLVGTATDSRSSFFWDDIPWGILSVLLVGAFFWYQMRRRNRM